MTKQEAIRVLLSRFKIGARVTHVEYDPAGSSTEYVPDERDLAVVEVLIGRKLAESDLHFSCGGPGTTYYAVPAEDIQVIAPPDLLAALKALREQAEKYALAYNFGHEGSEFLEVMSDAAQAINKAESGEVA